MHEDISNGAAENMDPIKRGNYNMGPQTSGIWGFVGGSAASPWIGVNKLPGGSHCWIPTSMARYPIDC